MIHATDESRSNDGFINDVQDDCKMDSSTIYKKNKLIETFGVIQFFDLLYH